jgi:hypothetical protein
VVLNLFSVLAVQNMVAYNAVSKTHEVEFKALESSLNMMSKGEHRVPPAASLILMIF